jgi:flagellar basal body rod protein FlgB
MNKQNDVSKFNQEINDFLEKWDAYSFINLIRALEQLVALYDFDSDEDDLFHQVYGKEDGNTIRMIKTVMILSKLCEDYASKMTTTNMKFKNLYKRLADPKNY